jgi:hypothetical protein
MTMAESSQTDASSGFSSGASSQRSDQASTFAAALTKCSVAWPNSAGR